MDSPRVAPSHDFLFPQHANEDLVEKDTFRCPTCSVELQDREDMINHIRSHSMASDVVDRRHVPTLHADKEKEASTIAPKVFEERTAGYRCRICEVVHETKEDAIRHMQEHSKKVEDETERKTIRRRMAFKCQKCGEELNSKDEFLDHMVVNHNAHPQMYGSNKVYCPDVKSVPQETTVVTYGCSQCTEQFTSKEDMLAHVHAKHASTGQLTFRCADCKKPFPSKEEVLRHMEEEHPKVTQFEARGAPIMSCPICKFGVNSRDEMAAHLRTHDSVNESFADTIEREIFDAPQADSNVSFRCSVCGILMASKLDVVRHMSDVHGNRQKDDATEEDEIPGKIVRQTDPTTGRAKTVVEKADGKTYVFDDEEAVKFVKLDEEMKKTYLSNLCMLGLRGFVTELGQRLIDESRLLKQRKQERDLMSRKSAYVFFGLKNKASKKDVSDAYKLKARQLHPDKNGGTEDAKARFQRMKALHEILKRTLEEEDSMEIERCTPATSPTPSRPDAADDQTQTPKEPTEAYDDEEPIKRDEQKTLSYDPRNRKSMENALERMSAEIANAWKNINLLSAEVNTLARELGYTK